MKSYLQIGLRNTDSQDIMADGSSKWMLSRLSTMKSRIIRLQSKSIYSLYLCLRLSNRNVLRITSRFVSRCVSCGNTRSVQMISKVSRLSSSKLWIFLAAHLCWATGFMCLVSWRGYWQELINSFIHASFVGSIFVLSMCRQMIRAIDASMPCIHAIMHQCMHAIMHQCMHAIMQSCMLSFMHA